MTLTPAQILKLADYHIRHFANLLDGRSPHRINRAECTGYLSLWTGIRERKGENLNDFQRREVLEAMWSGEFDEMLGIKTSQAEEPHASEIDQDGEADAT